MAGQGAARGCAAAITARRRQLQNKPFNNRFSGCRSEPSLAAVTTVRAGAAVAENTGMGFNSAGQGAEVVEMAREVMTGAGQLAAPWPLPPRPSFTVLKLQDFLVIPYITLLPIFVIFSPHLIVDFSSFDCCEVSAVMPVDYNHIMPNA